MRGGGWEKKGIIWFLIKIKVIKPFDSEDKSEPDTEEIRRDAETVADILSSFSLYYFGGNIIKFYKYKKINRVYDRIKISV